MQFEKWYFDFQNEDSFGYYYVSLLRLGAFCTTFTEVHHQNDQPFLHPFRMGTGCKKTTKAVHTSHADIQFYENQINLCIRHKNGTIDARWFNLTQKLSDFKQPVFKNEDGYCCWNVLVPYASVSVQIESESEFFEIEGTGYIDYVKLTIPFWRIPFQTLHWGRLFSDDGEWLILFHLKSDNNHLVYWGNNKGWHRGNKPIIRANENNEIKSFEWLNGRFRMEIKPVEKLQIDMILNPERMKWLPSKWRKKLCTNGFEKKYRVQSTFHNKKFNGIMEEVQWDE